MTDDQINQFQRFLNQQSFEPAFKVCRDAIDHDPSDWNAIYLAGITFRFRGDYATSVTYYRDALNLKPSAGCIWQALGIAFQNLGQFSEAIDALMTATKLEPDSYSSHNSLGLTYKMCGDYDSAMTSYQSALDVCTNRAFEEIRSVCPDFFGIEDRDGSKVLVLDPRYPDAMRDILVTDFDYFNTVKNMASCCIEMGDTAQAANLQKHADSCTPIDADLIGPIRPQR